MHADESTELFIIKGKYRILHRVHITGLKYIWNLYSLYECVFITKIWIGSFSNLTKKHDIEAFPETVIWLFATHR